MRTKPVVKPMAIMRSERLSEEEQSGIGKERMVTREGAIVDLQQSCGQRRRIRLSCALLAQLHPSSITYHNHFARQVFAHCFISTVNSAVTLSSTHSIHSTDALIQTAKAPPLVQEPTAKKKLWLADSRNTDTCRAAARTVKLCSETSSHLSSRTKRYPQHGPRPRKPNVWLRS